MPKKQETFVIIDGNAIIHRAYHALPPLTDKKGRLVNAVYGFTSMLLKVLSDHAPNYLAVSFDVAGPTFRDELYKEYKATRVKADQDLYDQIPLVHEVVRAFDIPIYTKEGFEADDVIGTVAQIVKKKGVRAIIVTGDMDMLQLVDDEKVEVYLLRKGLSDFELYDEAKVKEKLGFAPALLVDYKALRGDASDNIPGVKGIGAKTAKEIIETVGDIDALYKQLKKDADALPLKPAVRKKLEDGEEVARMSYDLARIRIDVPGLSFNLAQCKNGSFDRDKLVALFHEFGFTSLLKRLTGETQETNKKQETKKARTTEPAAEPTRVDAKNADTFLGALQGAEVFACREVLRGNDAIAGEIEGFLFTIDGTPYILAHGALSPPQRKTFLAVFADETKTIVGHDLKQFLKAAMRAEVPVKTQLFDVMIASYLINSSTRAHDMKSIALRELGVELGSSGPQESLFGGGMEEKAEECALFLPLFDRYRKELKELNMEELFATMEMALIPVLAQMEVYGVAVDSALLHRLSKDIKKEIQKTEEKIWEEAGEEFNVASSVQLRRILFDVLELPVAGVKKGKTGFSTAASELSKLRGTHTIIELIETHRELSKLQNTYADVLPKLIHPKTGRIHTSFNQAVTTTGRLSSSDPNLQNIPIRTEMGRKIRDAFIAAKGCVLLAADYSQIELRIAASVAEDKKMIAIFNKGQDIHRATAAVVNNVPEEDVTKEMRRAAKSVNFGVLYGMGAHGLAQNTGLPFWAAQEFIDKYFKTFSGLQAYIKNTLTFAQKNGYVETMFGRRRYIPELSSDNRQLRAAGERMAVNMPIQGAAADMMKMAMIAAQNALEKNYAPEGVKMILQVHDELVFEVKKGLEENVAALVKKTMEDVVTLKVPVVVEVGIGTRWGEIK